MQRFAEAAGWPILADPLSGMRTGPQAVSIYDALARVAEFCTEHRPDLVVRVGGPLTSKAVTRWLGPDVPQWLVDPDAAWLDPGRAATEVLAVEPETLLDAVAGVLDERREPTAWLESWLGAEQRARRALDGVLDGTEEVFEGRVARDLVAALPDGATLVVASSMPVRDVESFATPREGLRILANRGVNGIDGFVSTVLGVAAGGSGPVAALTGDLCFLHDSNGLLGAVGRGLDAVLVVVDNDGGGIFSFLPQADAPEHFEEIFATPHGIDLAALAAVHRIPCTVVERGSSLAPAVTAALDAGGVRIVLVRTERGANVERHRRAWAAVAAAVHA
jgi:2-succinyl-5-enolpyruvyl-6-hydroxy-3-cyclohexene-1-carboxylate synthase